MKSTLTILGLFWLAAAEAATPGTLRIATTNYFGTALTNQVQFIPQRPTGIGATVSWGRAIVCQPTNGFLETNLFAGRYEFRIVGLPFPRPVFFTMPDDGQAHDLTALTGDLDVGISAPPFVTQLVAGSNTVVTPASGKGVVTVHSTASGTGDVTAQELAGATNALRSYVDARDALHGQGATNLVQQASNALHAAKASTSDLAAASNALHAVDVNLQAQINELTGGPTNGVTSAQVTNIVDSMVAPQFAAKTGTNEFALLSADVALKASTYELEAATNQTYAAGTNYAREATNQALQAVAAAYQPKGAITNGDTREVHLPGGVVASQVTTTNGGPGTLSLTNGAGGVVNLTIDPGQAGETNVSLPSMLGTGGGAGSPTRVTSADATVAVTSSTSGGTNVYDLSVPRLSLVSTDTNGIAWLLDGNGNLVGSNTGPAILVISVPAWGITWYHLSNNVYAASNNIPVGGGSPVPADLEANQVTITNTAGGEFRWTIGTVLTSTNIGRIVLAHDGGLGELLAGRVVAAISGTHVDNGSIGTNAMTAAAYAAFIGGGAADPNSVTNNDTRPITFRATLAVTNGNLRVDNARITLTNWTGTGEGPAVNGYYPTALTNQFVFGIGGWTTSTNLLGGVDIKTGTNAGVGRLDIYAKKPSADWNLWTFDGPTGIAWGRWGGNGSGLTNLDAGSLASGTVPLARLSGINSNQIDAATHTLYMSGSNAVPTWSVVATNGIVLYTNNAGVLFIGAVNPGSDGTLTTNLVFIGGTNDIVGVRDVYGRNAYLNTIAITNPSGSIYWDGRTVLTSPTNGMVRLMNYGSTAFTGIQFGPTDATNTFLLNEGAGRLRLRRADGSGDGIFVGNGQGLYDVAASRVHSGAYIGSGNDVRVTNNGTASGIDAGSWSAPKVVSTDPYGGGGFHGDGAGVTNLSAAGIYTGTLPIGRLGIGTPDASQLLFGDNNWRPAPWMQATNGSHRGTLTYHGTSQTMTLGQNNLSLGADAFAWVVGDAWLALDNTTSGLGERVRANQIETGRLKADSFLSSTNNLAYTSTTLPFAGCYTTVCSGNIDFSSGISGAVYGTDGTVKLVIFPNGSDRTVTLHPSWRTDDGLGTYYATNGQLAVLTVNTSPGVYTNAILLPMRR